MARLTHSNHPGGLPLRYRVARHALNGLAEILRNNPAQRILISGGPRVGKSTLARKLAKGRRYHHGEELTGLEWSAGSQRASEWLDEPGPWICENVAMARALRKWLARNPVGKPADMIVVLRMPVDERVTGQDVMAAGVETVWQQIEPELIRRGVTILASRINRA